MAATVSEGAFINIPTPIITDILVRLPPIAVVRCRCVCKFWLKLLSGAEFVNLHLSKSPTGLIVLDLHPQLDSPSTILVQVEDETDHHDFRYIAGVDRGVHGHTDQRIDMTMIGSINGLVCIKEFKNEYDLIHIWNPVMGEFITVKPPEGMKALTTYGFGISSGKYQLVGIMDSGFHKERIRDSTCYIYTIKEGFWKNIGHVPYLYDTSDPCLFLNGNLHWLINGQTDPDEISCLDLETESFRPFPTPPELYYRYPTLSIYKDCISVCDNTTYSDSNLVIWVMKEYGVQSSWSKELVIDLSLTFVGYHYDEDVRIIKVFKDGEILLLWRDDRLFSYHPTKITLQDHLDVKEIMKVPSNKYSNESYTHFEVMDYVPSFVSPKCLGELGERLPQKEKSILTCSHGQV